MSFNVHDREAILALSKNCGEFLHAAMLEQRQGVFVTGYKSEWIQLGRTPLVVHEPIGPFHLGDLPRMVYGPAPDVDVAWGALVEAFKLNTRTRGASKRLASLVQTVAPEGLMAHKDGQPDSYRLAYLATLCERAGLEVIWKRRGFDISRGAAVISWDNEVVWVNGRRRLSWAVTQDLNLVRTMPWGATHSVPPKLGALYMTLIASFPSMHTALTALIAAIRDSDVKEPFYKHFDLLPLRREDAEQAGLWRECLGAIDTADRMPYWTLQTKLVPKVLSLAQFRKRFGQPERYHNQALYPIELRLRHREALIELHRTVGEVSPELARPDGSDDIASAHAILNLQDQLR